MLVLGIDPGYAIVGYGILDYRCSRFMPVCYGAITTPAGMEFDRRLEIIYQDLDLVMKKYRPDAMAIEQLFFTTNQKTAISVAQARGVILLCARQNQMETVEYTPLQVKQSVVGYGKAAKSQVMEMTRQLLNLKEIPKPDDTADALAIAICHCHSAGSRINLKKLQMK